MQEVLAQAASKAVSPTSENQPIDKGSQVPSTKNVLQPLSGKIIVVDAGHGGSDTGATRSGVMEKDINLAVALELKVELQSLGATVITTRDSDSNVSLDDRVAVLENSTPAADIFVSVHTNATVARNSSVDGIETYYYSQESKALADSLYNSLVAGLSMRGHWASKKALVVVHHDIAPSALVEIGYISSKPKRALLQTEAYQRQIALAIASGVVNYFEAVGSGSQSGPVHPSNTGQAQTQ
jgi:N-acetylmuramoyl-L-alanine amidase